MSGYPTRIAELECRVDELHRENAALREAAKRYVAHMRPYMADKDCVVCDRLVLLLDGQTVPSDCGSFNDGIEAAAAWLEEQAKCFIGNAKKELLAEAEDVRGLKKTDVPARGPLEADRG